MCRPITGVPRSNVIANGMGHRRELLERSRGSLRLFRQFSDWVSAPSASGVQRSTPSFARWLTSPRRCPNASAAVMGRRKRAGAMRTGRGKISTERASGSSRGADMPRWIASSSSLRRLTWGTRNSVAGWMTPLTTLAFLMPGTLLTPVGRQGGDPAVAPRRHCWPVVRSTAACPAFCSRS